MFANISGFDKYQSLWEENQALTSCFLDQAPIKSENLVLSKETEIDLSGTKSVYLVKEGILTETYQDNLILNYEAGDLAGADALVININKVYKTDFAISVDEYDGQQLLQYVQADPARLLAWNQYLMNLISAYQGLLSEHIKADVESRPEIRQYNQGDIIIKEGDNDNEVFTLITGSADVWVGSTQVGSIKPDEIFGAIAALTGTLRTASVIATSSCTVLVVPSERFHSLLCNRPATAEKLIKDMARTIVSSNKQIVHLSHKS